MNDTAPFCPGAFSYAISFYLFIYFLFYEVIHAVILTKRRTRSNKYALLTKRDVKMAG